MEYIMEMTAIFGDIEADLHGIEVILESVQSISKNAKDLPWVTEATKENSIKSKIKSAVEKIKSVLRKVLDFFNGKIFKKAEDKTKDSKLKAQKVSLKGVDPEKKKNQLDAQFKKIMEAKNKFMSMRGYNKAVVPIASILGWVPPFTPIPGATEMMVALSSIGDFLLDYKRKFCGQESSAIKEFNDWIESNIEKLDESDIYASDKILSRMTSFLGEILGEVKRLCLACSDKAFDAAKTVTNTGDKLSDNIKNEDVKKKLKNFNKKSKETLNKVSKDSKETLKKYSEYKKKKKEIKNLKKNKSISEAVDALADMKLFSLDE